jgi:hypothetical protein
MDAFTQAIIIGVLVVIIVVLVVIMIEFLNCIIR